MNLPAHLAQRTRPSMAQDAVAGLGTGRGPHISIKDNRFTWVDGAGNTRPVQTLYVDVVIVDVNKHTSRTYYDPSIPYDPEGGAAPTCFSDNGVGASSQAQHPQNASCQLCPKSAWNSAVSKMTGKGIPACSQGKKLAVVPPEGGNLVFQLRVPPASLTNWKSYVDTLVTHGLEPYDAFTRVEFQSQGVLKFSSAPIGENNTAFVTAAVVELTERIWTAKATIEATGKDDVSWTGQGDAAKVAYAERAQNATPSLPNAPMQPMAPPPQPFVTNTPRVGDPNDPRREQPFGGQQEQNGAANAFATQQAGPHDPFGQPSTSSPTAATPEAKTRKPRAPKAEPVADDGIPPFLKRDTPPPTTPAPNPTQFAPAPNTSFGLVQNPAAPDAGVQAALDAAFRLPT